MDKFKFCIWLVDTLLRRPLSKKEILSNWAYSASNKKQKEISERTFERDRREAEDLFEVKIEYSKLTKKYHLLEPETIQENKLLGWILASYRLGNISAEIKHREVVQLEAAAPKSEYLEIILQAIERKSILLFRYKSHYKEAEEIEFYPVFVRLCQQRWYVVGMNMKKNVVRVYAFERMQDLRLADYKVKVSHKIIPADFFAHSYGVLNDEEPQWIKIRAYWPQNLYLKDVPLHHSQELLEETDEYADFELFVRPTYDFVQALLAQREQLLVLEPLSLKNSIKETLTKILSRY